MAAIKKMKYETQLQFDPRYFFHICDVIDDVTGWYQSFPQFFMIRRGLLREQVARAM